MADIKGLFGFNRSDGTNKLLVAHGNDIVDVDTGLGYNQNLSGAVNFEFAAYLDYCFAAGVTNQLKAFDGTTWTPPSHVRVHAPDSYYIKPYRTKLYLAHININDTWYRSRVWHTDLPFNNDARWGLEWGNDLVQTADSATIKSAGSNFLDVNIKAGDPFFITSGTNAGEYTVSSITDQITIVLTETLDNSTTGSSFYVGSNYFDVRTNDNDYIRGIGENSDRLLIFKLNSVHRYNESSLFQIGDYPGTSSHRSITNVDGFTFYFHGSDLKRSGVYMYDGSQIVKVSTAIQPYIEGIDPSNYDLVVGWREGHWLRMYVGDISNTQRNLSVTKAVISYNVMDNKWSIDPITKNVLVATRYIENNLDSVFFGDDSSEVFTTPSGFDFDGSPIPWAVETGPQYPTGSETLNRFNRIQVIARDGRGVSVSYKLWNNPFAVDDNYQPLGDLKDDKTEFMIPTNHNWASGIDLRLEENGIKEPTQFIEKISIFYTPDSTRIP